MKNIPNFTVIQRLMIAPTLPLIHGHHTGSGNLGMSSLGK